MGTVAVGEANKMLDALVGRAAYTANTAVYAKLHTGAPGAAGTSNAAAETTRKLVTFGTAAASAAISNTAAITWTNLAATEVITHVSFWTDVTAGTFIGSDDLNASASATAGESLTIPIGDLDITISGSGIAVGEANKMLDAWAGRATYSASAAFYAQMHTGDPGAAGTSNQATHTTRVALTFGTAAASGAISCTAAASFTGITATGTESISWFSFWSAATAGTFLGRDDLATARGVTTGDGLTIAIGGVAISAT